MAWHRTTCGGGFCSARHGMARPAPGASLSTEGDVVCRSRKRRQPMPRSGTSHIARSGWFEPNAMLRSYSRGAWGVRWSARRRCGWVGDRGYIGVRVGHEGQYSALSVENNGSVPGFKQSTYSQIRAQPGTILVCKPCRAQGRNPDDIKLYACEICGNQYGWKKFPGEMMKN